MKLSVLFRHLAILSLMFSLFGCSNKANTLQGWLDKNFKNQYEVVDTRMNILPSLYKEKKRESVVALKSDPEVQFEVTWYKNAPELRMTKDEIVKATELSKNEVAQSRQLFQEIQKSGSSKMSVSVIEDAAYFLLFEEPTVDNRKKYLEQILTYLDSRPEHTQTSIFIEFMEDSMYQKEFKDIVTRGYWNRTDKHYEHHKIVALDFEWKPGLKVETLMTGWAVNSQSDKTFVLMADAFQVASQWAEKNITAPYYLEPSHFVQYDIDEHDPMAIHYYFPYFTSKPLEDGTDYAAKQKGFVTGVYQVDQKAFTKIKTVKEL
jgi:hypothetical protein